MPLYDVNHHSLNTILSWISSGEISIPDIQRPFIWTKQQVRDLIDSLYRGYPIGYIVIWQGKAKSKSGRIIDGDKIIIDGQQRLTAFRAALLGHEIFNKNYKKEHIRVAYNLKEDKFELYRKSLLKDPDWIPDISILFKDATSILELVDKYKQNHPELTEEFIIKRLQRLTDIIHQQIGVITLSRDLDIDTVATIFERLNSKGTKLNRADLVMARLGASGKLGSLIRKIIDYADRSFKNRRFVNSIPDVDPEFANSDDYHYLLSWINNEEYDTRIYTPDYSAILFMLNALSFQKGKLLDMIKVFSEPDKLIDRLNQLQGAVKDILNKTNYLRFITILKSAGFISPALIVTPHALNASYTFFVTLRRRNFPQEIINKVIRRWIVFSILTTRYAPSFESQLSKDIKDWHTVTDPLEYLEKEEKMYLGESFWKLQLREKFLTNVSPRRSSVYLIYVASLIRNNTKVFLDPQTYVRDLIEQRPDFHHIFPRNYLHKLQIDDQLINVPANFVITHQSLNIKIRDRAPSEYLSPEFLKNQLKLSLEPNELDEMFSQHSIPKIIRNVDNTIDSYTQFVQQRSQLMAEDIRKYYREL